jgi:hypothetical protein
MYPDGTGVWRGLRKNAVEGMAAPRLIVPVTALLLFGQVLPLPLLVAAVPAGGPLLTPGLLAMAVLLSYLPRLLAVRRFQQSLTGALLHPLGVALLLVMQWQALILWLLGRPAAWRGRGYRATLREG